MCNCEPKQVNASPFLTVFLVASILGIAFLVGMSIGDLFRDDRTEEKVDAIYDRLFVAPDVPAPIPAPTYQVDATPAGSVA
jgi:hypothetical protein